MSRDPYIFKRNIRIMKNNTYTSLRTLSEEDKWCIPIIKRGKGPYLYDVDDNRFVDFFMGNCSLLLGHSEPVITSCIKGWLARGYAQGYPGPAQTLLSHRISDTLGDADDGETVWTFFNSGWEAGAAVAACLKPLTEGIYACDDERRTIFEQFGFNRVRLDDLKKSGSARFVIVRANGGNVRNGENGEKLRKTIEATRKRGCLVIYDETDFESAVHTGIMGAGGADGRIFGSWLCSGLSFGCVSMSGRLAGIFTERFRGGSYTAAEGLGFPPLYKVKAALRFLDILKKRGGIQELVRHNREFGLLLQKNMVELKNGLVYIRKEARTTSLRTMLMRAGFYTDPFLSSPLFVSFAHSGELNRRSAEGLNKLFESLS